MQNKKVKLPLIIISLLAVFTYSVSSAFAALDPLPAGRSPFGYGERYATDLFSGTASYSYPIKVPKGTNDLTPDVSLSYNSGDARSTIQRVGIGWQMSQDYIERDVNFTPSNTSDDKFKLHFKGGIYDLVYVSSDNRYHTKIESFLNIQQLSGGQNDQGQYWQVITQDGTKYRFGYQSQSELACNGQSYITAWNLDQVTDTHGNTIYYTYTESNGTAYLSQIKYNTDQQREVDFSYSSASYQRQLINQGCSVTESSKLDTIQVKVNAQLVHQYELVYTAAVNSQLLLTSIAEKGSNGTMLPATTFDYKTENNSWNTTPETWINNADIDVNLEKTDVIMADVNGDGLLDIVKSEGNGINTWKVWRNTGNGWNTTYETWINNASIDSKLDRSDTRFMDVNGDGLPDIIKTNGATSWTVFRNTGNSWNTIAENWGNLASYGGNIDLTNNGVRLIDVTGDSLPDVVYTVGGYWRIFRNTGNNWNGTPEQWWNNSGTGLGLDDPTIRVIDVNGDGLPDIVKATANGTNDTWQVWKNTGSGWSTSSETWINNAGVDANFSMTNVTVQDVNGDGLPDIIKSDELGSADRWKVLLNQGNSWSTNWVNWIDPSSSVDLSLQGNTQMADVTGDGLPDIIRTTSSGGSFDTWQIWRNSGLAPDLLSNVHTSQGGTIGYNYVSSTNPISEVTTNAPYTGEYFNNQNLSGSPALTRTDSAINFDWGSGSPDPSISSDLFSVRWTQTTSFTGGTYIFTASSDDGLRLYVDGELILDQWTDTGYLYYTVSKALSSGNHTIKVEYYEDYGGARARLSYQKIGLPFSVWQVSQMMKDNGLSNTQNTHDLTNYTYKNASYKFEDHDFRGFGEVNTIEPNNAKKKYIFNQDNAAKGKVASLQTTDNSGNPYDMTEDSWTNVLTNGIYTSNLNSEKKSTYDGSSSAPKVSEIDYQYDQYGNVTKKSELGDTSATGDERFTYNTYTYNPGAWLVNEVSDTYINSPDDSTKASETTDYYDNNANLTDAPTKGDITKEIKWLNGGTSPITQYMYDSYGNQTQLIDANGHITQATYGTNDTTHTYPDSTTNAKNQTTSTTYDLGTGNVLSKTDTNGFTTTYTYDAFGRVKTEIDPYDTSGLPTITYQYFDGTAPQGMLVSKRKATGTSPTFDSYTFVDGLGRKVQTRTPAQDTTKQIVVDTFYDPVGKVLRETVAHIDTLLTAYVTPIAGIEATISTYDPIGRVISVTNPQGTSKTTNYNHWVETNTDENGHQIKNYRDAYYNIVQVDELIGSAAQTTKYIYDVLNNLTKITDANNNNFIFTYDTLGKKISQNDPDLGVWNYTYDAVGNLLTKKDNRNVTTTRTYDELNRLTKVDYPTDTDVTYTYDGNSKIGTLTSVTDAAGTVNYTYDNRLRKTQEQRVMDATTWTTQFAYDDLNNITSRTNPDGEVVTYTFNPQNEVASVNGIVNNINYDALGHIMQKTFANGLSTNYSYNANDFRLNRIQTGTVQDQGYTYDAVGNVSSITDNLLSKTQTFGYDSLNRLTTASETGGYNYTYAYDPIGNITAFTGSGTQTNYTYGQNTLVHALVAASSTTMIYDDSLAYGWTDASFNTTDTTTSTNVYTGTTALSSTIGANGGLDFQAPANFTTGEYTYVRFALKASQAGQQYDVYADSTYGQALNTPVSLANYGGQPNANGWIVYNIPLADLGATNVTLGDLVIHNPAGTNEPALYVDQVQLMSGVAPTPIPTNSPTPTPTGTAQAPSLVQKNLQALHNTNSNAVSFASNVTSGHLLLVAVASWQGTVSNITDNHGNTYTAVASPPNAGPSGDYAQLYYAKNVTGGATTVTVSFSATTDTSVGIYEYAGLDTVSPLDKTAGASGASTTPNGGTLTTTVDNELYFALGLDQAGNQSPAAGSGYTLENHQDDIQTHEPFYSEDRVSVHGSYAANFSISSSQAWAVIGASFKPSSGTTTPTPTPTSATTPTPTPTGTVQTPTLVQKNFQALHTTSPNAITFASNVTSGNLILVAITSWQATVSNVTDNHGNTYTAVATGQHANTSADYTYLYYAKNVTGGSLTVTTTFSSATDETMGVYEYSGVDKTAPLDQIAATTGVGTTPNGGNLTTTTDNELYFAIGLDDYGTAAPTAGSGYTLEDHQDDDTTHERYYSEDRVATHGTYATNFSITVSHEWAVIGASFKPATSGATPTPTPTSGATPTPTPTAAPAVIVDATSSDWVQTNTNNFSWNHTTTSQSNRLLMVEISTYDSTTTVSSVSYNGTALTQVNAQNCGGTGTCRDELWYVLNPASGTHAITVATNQSLPVTAAAITLYNVNQSTPFGTASTTSGTGTSSSVSPASNTSQLVADFYANQGAGTSTPTVGSGQTQQVNLGGGAAQTSAISTKAGSTSSTPMTWSWTSSNGYGDIGVGINHS